MSEPLNDEQRAAPGVAQSEEPTPSDQPVSIPSKQLDTDGADGTEWRQLHWAFIIIGLIRNIRGLIVPLAIVLISGGMNGNVVGYGIAGVAAVFAGLFSVTEWWFYRYAVTARGVIVRSGVISKQERSVPFGRIQAVDLEEAPLDRIFGVTRMRIETAAGGSAESDIRIQALSKGDAQDLRARLMTARQRARSGETGAMSTAAAMAGTGASEDVQTGHAEVSRELEGDLVRRLSTRELLIAGATSGRIGPAAAIAGGLAQFGDDLIPESWWERIPADRVADAAASWQVISGLVLFIGLFAWALAIGSTALTFSGFELRRTGDQILLQYGLLERRRTTIPIRRVQAIRVSEGLLRQPFGYAEVRFESAGFGGTQSADSGVLFPLLPVREIGGLLREACPEFAADLQKAPLDRLPRRALPRYVVGRTIGWLLTAIGVNIAVYYALDGVRWWSVALLLVAPLFAVFGWIQYRDTGWMIDDDRFVLRSRPFGRTTLVTRLQRIQHRRLTTNPFQRRASLATFRGAVASGGMGGGFELAHLDVREAERLIARLRGTRRRKI